MGNAEYAKMQVLEEGMFIESQHGEQTISFVLLLLCFICLLFSPHLKTLKIYMTFCIHGH